MPPSTPSRAAFTTATVVAAIALLAATIALAAAARPAKGLSAGQHTHSVPLIQQLVPPPGVALLLIAGLVAARRGPR